MGGAGAGCRRPLGSGRARLGSEPALSPAPAPGPARGGGVGRREAWLELEEAAGLGGPRSPSPGASLRSDSLRHLASLPAASSSPAQTHGSRCRQW